MNIILGDGRSLRVGRPVVKNVAGYDLTRLMVGSFGTLGLIAEVTLRVTPLPRLRRSLLVPIKDLEQGLALGQYCLPISLVASAVLLSRELPTPISANLAEPFVPYWFIYTAEGLPEDVETELDLVREVLREENTSEPLQIDAFSGTKFWHTLLGEDLSSKIKVRSGVAPKDLATYARSQEPALALGPLLLDFASGFVYAAANPENLGEARVWVDCLRQEALRLDGYSMVIEMPSEWESHLERFGYRPESLPIMRNLKKLWDPAGILNPGAFVR